MCVTASGPNAEVAPLDEEHSYRDSGPGGDVAAKQYQADEDECSDHAKPGPPPFALGRFGVSHPCSLLKGRRARPGNEPGRALVGVWL